MIAASTWATVRVRLGPIRAKSATASARPALLAISASAASSGSTASQRQCPNTASGNRNGVTSMAKLAKALVASEAKRTVSVLRGSSGEENSRSRSPRV